MKEVLNEDVIFPTKDDDGELFEHIPKDISEIGDYLKAQKERKSKELLQKLEDNKELLNKPSK